MSQLAAGGIAGIGLCHAAGVATPPILVALDRSAPFTLDPKFSGEGGAIESTESTGPGGEMIRSTTASYLHRDSYTAGTSSGSGTRTTSTHASLDATETYLETSAPNAYRFESDFAFSTTYQYSESLITTGRFFFVAVGELNHSFRAQNAADIVVNQTLYGRLTLQGSFQTAPFGEIFNSIMLMNAPYDFTGIRLLLSSQTLSEESIIRSGTTGKTRYHFEAQTSLDGIDLEFRLDPLDATDPETLRLRWFLDGSSELQYLTAISKSGTLADGGGIREQLAIVPEPSAAMLAATALALGLRRRRPAGRRPPASFHQDSSL